MIGSQIRKARGKAGMTQTEVARRMGIPYQGFSQWERGIRNPKFGTVEKIAEALNVSVNYLLEIDDAPNKPSAPAGWDENHRCTACGKECITVTMPNGTVYHIETPHCPNCGEKMEVQEDD